MFLWFGFYWLSNALSKIGNHFRKQNVLKFKFKKNVNNDFDIEIDYENQFLTTGLKVSGSWIKKHFSMYIELIFEQEPTQRVDACPQNFAR